MARAAQHYEDSTGRQVHGLGQRPSKDGKPGRFYAIKDRNRTFGTDESDAIRRFRLWEQQRAGSAQIFLKVSGFNLAPDLQQLV